MNLLALTQRNGVRLAELAFVVVAAAGVAIAVGALAPTAGKRFWNVIGGGGLVLAAVLLVVAAHWGHFGSR
jgi:hypothetical protein